MLICTLVNFQKDFYKDSENRIKFNKKNDKITDFFYIIQNKTLMATNIAETFVKDLFVVLFI